MSDDQTTVIGWLTPRDVLYAYDSHRESRFALDAALPFGRARP